MEVRVEAGGLGHTGKMALRQANDRQCRRRVQWRKAGGAFELTQNRRGDQAVPPQPRSTMDDAVADDSRSDGFELRQRGDDPDERLCDIRDRVPVKDEDRASRVLGAEAAFGGADRLRLS